MTRLLAFVLLPFLLLAAPAWAITFDAASSSEGTTSTSHSATIAEDANIAIVCVAIRETGGAPAVSTAVTVGGQAATLLDAINIAASVVRVEMWYKLSPLTGTQTVAVTSDATTDMTVTGIMTFKGVAQTSTFNTVKKVQVAGSTTNMDTDTITSAVGEYVALCGAVRTSAGADPTLAPAGTPLPDERYEDPHTTDVSILGMGYTQIGATPTAQIEIDATLAAQYATVAVSMRAGSPRRGSVSILLY